MEQGNEERDAAASLLTDELVRSTLRVIPKVGASVQRNALRMSILDICERPTGPTERAAVGGGGLGAFSRLCALAFRTLGGGAP